MSEFRSDIVIEEVTDPDEIARHHRVAEAGRRNSAWLEAHWGDLLPARSQGGGHVHANAQTAQCVSRRVDAIRR